MEQKLKTICVYCGASSPSNPVYIEAMEALSRGLVDRGIRIVYGGGDAGTMGVLASTAIDHGGEVIGIIPGHLIGREGQLEGLRELHIVDSMHERKMMMAQLSDAFIVMPGGLGTLDETFEILTWKYLDLHHKPVFIANINQYWSPMLKMIKNMIDVGFTPEHHLGLFHWVETVEDILREVDHISQDELQDKDVLIDKM